MLPAYAELHCLSNFSFLRGASHPEELVERAHALGYPALALTDECSVAGAVRAHLAAELTASGGDRLRLERLMALSRDCGLPLVASGDVHMHVRARRALQDTLTAIRLKTPLAQCGYALFPNGERHMRSRARLANIYPPELLAQTLALVERCTFSLDELRYEYPEEIAPSGETPTSYLRRLTEAGLQKRYGDRVPDDV